VWKAFYAYSWPGNVRELENVIERSVVLNSGGKITLDDLPEDLIDSEEELDFERFVPANLPLPKALEKIEEKLIRNALARCSNVQSHAAESLGITKSLIQHKIKKYNIAI
jgi:two-component system NtrC family response regulator